MSPTPVCEECALSGPIRRQMWSFTEQIRVHVLRCSWSYAGSGWQHSSFFHPEHVLFCPRINSDGFISESGSFFRQILRLHVNSDFWFDGIRSAPRYLRDEEEIGIKRNRMWQFVTVPQVQFDSYRMCIEGVLNGTDVLPLQSYDFFP